MHQRFPGTHGDAPEAELHPGRNKRLLDEVVVADRGASERHQHVGLGVAGAANRRFHGGHFIHRDAKIDRDSSVRLDNPGDGEIVGCDDLRRPQRPAGRDQFVACCKNGDPCAATDHELCMVRRGRERHISGAEATAGRNEGFAFAEIHAGLTQIVAGRRRARKPDALLLALDVLLNDDGIGPAGIGAPVKIRTASPGPTSPSKARPAADSPITVNVAGAGVVSAARSA